MTNKKIFRLSSEAYRSLVVNSFTGEFRIEDIEGFNSKAVIPLKDSIEKVYKEIRPCYKELLECVIYGKRESFHYWCDRRKEVKGQELKRIEI